MIGIASFQCRYVLSKDLPDLYILIIYHNHSRNCRTNFRNVPAPMDPCSGVTVTSHRRPNQPSLKFKRDNNNRSFKAGWFQRWEWLDWSDSLERVLCFPCRMVTDELGERMLSNKNDSAFLRTGFYNWKDASRCFNKHEKSE